MKPMKPREVIKILEKDGWYLKNQLGSHRHYIHPIKKGKVQVPVHNKELLPKTLSAILKQAGLK